MWRRVLLVDDDDARRRKARALIDASPDLRVCGEAADPFDALRHVDEAAPDVVLVHLSAGSLDLLRDLRARRQDLPAVAVSARDEAVFAARALRAGARGFVNDREASDTLLAALRRVLSGELHVSAGASAHVLRSLSGGAAEGVDRLTDRELSVLELVGRGRRSREIAAQLQLSVKAIEAHRARIRRKLDLTTGADLVRYAQEWVRTPS